MAINEDSEAIISIPEVAEVIIEGVVVATFKILPGTPGQVDRVVDSIIRSGNVTPQQSSPQQQYPPQAGSHDNTPQYTAPPEEEEDADDLFRPSKDLQVEDKEETKKNDDEKMPPPSRPPPTGPQSQQNSKFSFAFKGPSKATPTPPKPEISQKLNATPSRRDVNLTADRPRGPNSRNIPTEPASARRPDFREPPPPTTIMVKKKIKREKERPKLEEEFLKSDSVYYRKPGNESVVGSGTYGKVFKAIHVYTKSLVALKKIRMEGERDGFPVTAVREIRPILPLRRIFFVRPDSSCTHEWP